ncbi:DUF3784 domain-containing protein [Dyadobacter fermentans]|uniref:Bacterial Pleckstrin homology domain-containing protein n=1 Tax=Dyadobacter fermentans (strain ATCC 700827 / DSM 18053 / CIP 107007 / KCTC 52180 / NS114) TaxID=471854 RepID=C6W003_DYAFD|nr:DUF3784 domain-containing protein [Dyadobacter fermentans]ACT95330.1 hypothetical protein Dfer_4127 [Dyadobacter fermentans DSM 18053]
MLIATLIFSTISFLLAFVVTPGNARYLLSGYNMMSEADRAKFDIEAYLKFFSRFHIFLAISLITGVLVLNVFSPNWATVFLIMYPLLSYGYMMAMGNRFYTGTSGQRAGTYVGMAILLVVSVGVGFMLFSEMRDSQIFLTDNALEIRGASGMKIPRKEVTFFTITDSLPSISSRANGFSGGNFSKGSFKTDDGRVVKLYINKKSHPYLLIKTNEDEIYFSSDEISALALLNQLKSWKSL